MRVIIVDNHYGVRQGLAFAFQVVDEITVVGQARDEHEAIALCVSRQPDILLMDMKVESVQTIQAIHQQAPHIKIFVRAGFLTEETSIESALEAGATTCIPITASLAQVVGTICGETEDGARDRFAG